MVTWNDIKIADKAFLINLKERQDRLLESISELEKLNIRGVERFEAVKFTHDSNKGKIIRGCTQSHIDILKYQVENKLHRVIIFEDDFCLDIIGNSKFEISDETIINIGEIQFDLLFLGSCLIDKSLWISKNLIKPNNFVQTTCYIVGLNFAKFVVDNFNYLDEESLVYGEAIDSFYSILSSKRHWLENTDKKDKNIILENDFKIYFHNPILFSQRPSFSNLINKKVNYLSMNRYRNMKYLPDVIN